MTGLAVSEKLKKTVQWTFYVFILLIVVIGYLFPLFNYVFSEEPSSKITGLMNYAGVGLSFSSLALAFYSLFTSATSQRKLDTSLSSINGIQQNLNSSLIEVKMISHTILNSQDRIESRFNAIKSVVDVTGGTDASVWAKDRTGPRG